MSMSSLRSLLGVTVVAVAISVVSAAEDASPGKSASTPTILNGSFEQKGQKDTRPEAWFAARPPKSESRCTMSRCTDVAKDGSASVCIDISKDHPEERVSYNWATQITDFTPGRTYSLEAWVKTERVGSTPVVVVQCWGKKNQPLAFATTEKEFDLKGNNDWKPVKTTFKVPAGTEIVMVRAALSAEKNPGAKAWFDGIGVSENTAPERLAAEPTDTSKN